MNSELKNEHPEHPSETKLFYGIQYWVSVPAATSTFVVTIGQGEFAIDEAIDCPDVPADNYQELFQRGHAHAQKIIQTKGAELHERFGRPEDEEHK